MSTRNGKIARLPFNIREHLNRKLRDGEKSDAILAWVNAFPETQALCAEDYKGEPISEMNLSNWRNGGYADWERAENTLDIVRSIREEAQTLRDDPDEEDLADDASTLLEARVAIAIRNLPNEETADKDALKTLTALSAQLCEIRRTNAIAAIARIQEYNSVLAECRFRLAQSRLNQTRDQNDWKNLAAEPVAYPRWVAARAQAAAKGPKTDSKPYTGPFFTYEDETDRKKTATNRTKRTRRPNPAKAETSQPAHKSASD